MDSNDKFKVCVIGAGPCALSLLHFLKDASIEIQVFEKQGEIGGMWTDLDSWRVGTDQFGLPCHHSMYKDLWSNGPKEALEYADYSFRDHFNKNIGSFPPRRVIKDYILGRAKQDNVLGLVNLYHNVSSVIYDALSQKFLVKVVSLKEKVTRNYEFDYVVVSSGHFSTPNVPSFPGIETFRGRVLHSHDMRGASEFAGKNLLLVGSSYSAEDISLQVIKFGASSVTVSYRSKPMGYDGWPQKFLAQKPLIQDIRGNTVNFIDGSSGEYDVIMFCTGYLLDFPFLDDSLRLNSPNTQYPPLYKGVVYPKNSKLFYMGMQDLWYTFTMFDVQALYISQVIAGVLPIEKDQQEMETDIQTWLTHLDSLSNKDDEISYKRDIYFQSDYINDLIMVTYYSHKLDCRDMLLDWERHKYQNILTYRDQCFTSIITNDTSPSPTTPWFEAFDDSLAGYLERF